MVLHERCDWCDWCEGQTTNTTLDSPPLLFVTPSDTITLILSCEYSLLGTLNTLLLALILVLLLPLC
ncbi:hypothetical protein BJX76DRAFT_331957 [Aspergillus varians]